MLTIYERLSEKAVESGATDARVIGTEQIVFDPRSALKCRFGCNRWGRYWTCPPLLNLSQKMFDEAFSKYRQGIILQTGDPKQGQDIAVAIEKEAMLSHGCLFAFALALCVQCDPCAYPDTCRYPHLARPAMDAFGVDVAKTVASLGLKTEFDKKGNLIPAWYTLVMVD